MADVLRAIKAMADEHRLRILALLSQSPHTGEQLALLLGLRPSTISHHLARLKHVGLVRAEAEGYYSVYHLEADSLTAIVHRLGEHEMWIDLANAVYIEAHARRQTASARDREPRTRRNYRRRRKS